MNEREDETGRSTKRSKKEDLVVGHNSFIVCTKTEFTDRRSLGLGPVHPLGLSHRVETVDAYTKGPER